MAIYSGYILREFFDAHDEMSEIVSEKKICIDAPSKEAAELMMHEIYSRDEKKYIPNRTSDKFPGDKISIRGLGGIESTKSIDCIIEKY